MLSFSIPTINSAKFFTKFEFHITHSLSAEILLKISRNLFVTLRFAAAAKNVPVSLKI